MGPSAVTGTAGLPAVRATRYVTPLREGGSLPALVEADDDGLYVCKFRGAGQGPRALVAELVAGGLGRAAGLPVPDLVLVTVDAELGAAEPDPEIQDLLRASVGVNTGMDFLPGALPFDPAQHEAVDPGFAAEAVWFDALVTNVDRTARNPNMLVWHGRLYLIDHGAALYLHHVPGPLAERAGRAFPQIADHVLLPRAGSVTAAHARCAPLLDARTVEAVLDTVPDALLDDADRPGRPGERRAEYADYLRRRLEWGGFAEEAEEVRRGR